MEVILGLTGGEIHRTQLARRPADAAADALETDTTITAVDANAADANAADANAADANAADADTTTDAEYAGDLLAQGLTGFCGLLYDRDFPGRDLQSYVSEEQLIYARFAAVLQRAVERFELRGRAADAGAVPVPVPSPWGLMVGYARLPRSVLAPLSEWRRRAPAPPEIQALLAELRGAELSAQL